MNYNNVLRFGFILAKTPSFIFAKKFEIVKKTHSHNHTKIVLKVFNCFVILFFGTSILITN